ncbi:hypothetical protein FKV68_23930 (plasmid) [Sinorhizobium mexicanum]|uniref:Uncharacterized protein n=1 Tax=Sinorhizobium mexicanum TaxID=375549 RepID=A0A859R4E0_9HYPH|nr:hypothetical protein FKV68_23930 [Sinorhizobium mexicanum]
MFRQIQEYENGKNRVSAAIPVRICQAMQISPMGSSVCASLTKDRPTIELGVGKIATAERKLAGVQRALRDEWVNAGSPGHGGCFRGPLARREHKKSFPIPASGGRCLQSAVHDFATSRYHDSSDARGNRGYYSPSPSPL